MPTTIYALCEPDLQVPVIRYIGKTVAMKERFSQHLKQSIKKPNHLGNWLRSLEARGEKPVLLTLTEVSDEIGSAAEILYIRLAREGGMDLVNATDGGEGITMTPETREKISSGQRGEKHYLFGKHLPEKTRKAISATLTGRRASPEHCAAIGARFRGKPKTLAQRKAMGVSKIGSKNHQFGKVRSPEHCAKLVAANTGRKDSEEAKANKRRAAQARSKDQKGFCRGWRQSINRQPYFSNGGGI